MVQGTQSPQISQKQDECNIYAVMKTMCLPSYQHNDFAVTHALGQMMYRYTLLVPMNERMLNKPSIECNISGCKWSNDPENFQEDSVSVWNHFPHFSRASKEWIFHYYHISNSVNCNISLNLFLVLSTVNYSQIYKFSKTVFRSTFGRNIPQKMKGFVYKNLSFRKAP